MKFPILLALVLIACGSAGCSQKRQDAVVVGKEFIAAETGETLQNPRAMNRDQWLVKIEMENGRKVDAPVEKAQWEALKIGDRVKASYSEGNYTGTIWSVDVSR